METRWYLVHAKTGRELFAEFQLRRQGYETFLPMTLKSVRNGRQLRTVRTAYFPSYLFVSLDLDRDRWRPINGTLGVVRLVCAKEAPLAAPRGLVEGLRIRTDAEGVMDLARGLEVGDPVTLIGGPFAGHHGVVEQLRGSDRVRVLLEIMNRAMCIDVGRENFAAA